MYDALFHLCFQISFLISIYFLVGIHYTIIFFRKKGKQQSILERDY